MAHAGDESPQAFTLKFNHLVATVFPRTKGEPYSPLEISEGIKALGGRVSRNYVLAMIRGEKANPSLTVAQWICRFFDVPLNYFDMDTTEYDEKLKVLASLRDAGVENVTRLSVGLTPASLDLLADLAVSLRKQEGLPLPRKSRTGGGSTAKK